MHAGKNTHSINKFQTIKSSNNSPKSSTKDQASYQMATAAKGSKEPQIAQEKQQQKIKLRVHHLRRNLSRFLRNQDKVQILVFSASQIKIKTNRHSNIDGESP